MGTTKKEREILSKANPLSLTPVRLVAHTGEIGEGVALQVPKFRHPVIARWVSKTKRGNHFRLELDENGSRVWQLIDGQRNVMQIAEELQESAMEQAYERVSRFIAQLYRDGLITFKELQ